jgi:repressor LexA
MSLLTEKQTQVLDYIKLFIHEEGFPPTRAEISEAFAWKSPNAAEDHLRALERRGAIQMRRGTSRGIKVCS